jgi:HK97 family phage portal protein
MWLFKSRTSAPKDIYASKGSFVPLWSRPPSITSHEWISYFSKSPRLAVIDRIASDLSNAEGKLYQSSSTGLGGEREITSHPFLDFWSKPNPLHEMSRSALWRLFEIYLLLVGEAYFAMSRDARGMPAELWPVPSHWIQQAPHQGYPFYQMTLSSGEVATFPVEDIFLMRELSPLDPYQRGLGKSESLADEVETDEYASKYQKKFFFNDATPAVAYAMPGSTQEQRARFLADIRRALGGVHNSHGAIAVDGGMSILKLSENMKDMDMVQGRVFIRDATLERFNMPREIMGITENSNRATADAAQAIYAQNVLAPRLQARQEMINEQLLPWFGDGLSWRYDDIVPHNSEFNLQLANEGLSRGVLTVDEWREMNGMAPLPNRQGAVLYVPMSSFAVGLGESIVQAAEGALAPGADDGFVEIEGGGVSLKAGARAGSARLRSRALAAARLEFQRARVEKERGFETASKRFLKGQAERIKAALDSSPKAEGGFWDELEKGLLALSANAVLEDELAPLLSGLVGSLLNWGGEDAKLYGLFKPLWLDAYNKGASVSKSAYSFGVDQPVLRNLAKLGGTGRIAGINAGSQKALYGKIMDLVAEGIRLGDTGRTMSEKVEGALRSARAALSGDPGGILGPAGDFARRARAIAQTESHTSIMAGSNDMMSRAGVARKQWLSSLDGKVRPSHARANNLIAAMSQPYEFRGMKGKLVRLDHPGDPKGPPEEVINCRCDSAPTDDEIS